jgi:hypothetical protein
MVSTLTFPRWRQNESLIRARIDQIRILTISLVRSSFHQLTLGDLYRLFPLKALW